MRAWWRLLNLISTEFIARTSTLEKLTPIPFFVQVRALCFSEILCINCAHCLPRLLCTVNGKRSFFVVFVELYIVCFGAWILCELEFFVLRVMILASLRSRRTALGTNRKGADSLGVNIDIPQGRLFIPRIIPIF